MLQELLELKLEEIDGYKVEIFQFKRQLTEYDEETKRLKQEVEGFIKKDDESERRKDRMIKRKIEKLKEVKSLLAEGL